MKAFCNILAVLAVIVIVGFSGSAQAALVGYWPFDMLYSGGAATPNLGIGGAALTGSMVGDATLEANVSDGSITRGSALLLDGAGDEVVIHDGVTKLHGGAAYTVAAWIKTTGQNQAILGKDRNGIWEQGSSAFFANYTHEVLSWHNLNGKIDMLVGWNLDGVTAPDGSRYGTPIADGQWHHIALTNRADTGPFNLAKVYIDGVDVSGYNETWWTIDSGNTVRIGNSRWLPNLAPGDPGGGFFDGHIDDVAIYNQALSGDQIQTLMNDGPQDFTLPQTAPGPVSLWGIDVTQEQGYDWGAHGLLYDNTNGWGLVDWDLVDAGQDYSKPEEAIFTAEQPLSLGGLTELIFTIKSENLANYNLGKFRLSVTTDDQVEFSPAFGEDGNWIELVPRSVESANGTTLNILGDNSILASGIDPATEILTVTVWTDLDNITGYRLEVLEDPSLPTGGPGRAIGEGNCVLTYFGVEAVLVPEPSTFILLTSAAAGLLCCLIRKRRRVA